MNSNPLAGTRGGQRGFSLIEAIAATIVATVAVIGLAHSFGVGRGLIHRSATARDAVAAAQRRMETLARTRLTSPDFSPGTHPVVPAPILLNDDIPATETWVVTWINDPADDAGGDPVPQDYKKVTVRIAWTQGGVADTAKLSRYFMPR